MYRFILRTSSTTKTTSTSTATKQIWWSGVVPAFLCHCHWQNLSSRFVFSFFFFLRLLDVVNSCQLVWILLEFTFGNLSSLRTSTIITMMPRQMVCLVSERKRASKGFTAIVVHLFLFCFHFLCKQWCDLQHLPQSKCEETYQKRKKKKLQILFRFMFVRRSNNTFFSFWIVFLFLCYHGFCIVSLCSSFIFSLSLYHSWIMQTICCFLLAKCKLILRPRCYVSTFELKDIPSICSCCSYLLCLDRGIIWSTQYSIDDGSNVWATSMDVSFQKNTWKSAADSRCGHV